MRESLFAFCKTRSTPGAYLNFTNSSLCKNFSEGKTEKITKMKWTYSTDFKLDNKQTTEIKGLISASFGLDG